MKTSEELEQSIKAVWVALDDVSASQQAANAEMRARSDKVAPLRMDEIKHEPLCALLSKLAHPNAMPAIADDDDARALWAQVGKLYRVGADLGIYPKESP